MSLRPWKLTVFYRLPIFMPMPVSILAFAFILAFILVLSPPRASAQSNRNAPYDFYGSYDSGVFTLADKHFRGVLFPEVYKRLPSVKADWPGLWLSDQNSAAAGLLPDRLAAGAGWNGVYGWADINNQPGMMGLWLGNFNMGRGYRVSEYFDMAYFWDTRDFELRGAFWVSPFRNDRFKGVSVTFDIDNAYAFNGNEFDGLTNILGFYINISTLTRISDRYMLRAGLRTYNRHSDDPTGTWADNRRLFRDGLHVSLIDDKLRTLELWGGNTFAMNGLDEKTDTLSAGLRFTKGWATSYLKHTLFYGVKAEASAFFVSKIDQNAGSFQYGHYLKNATFEGRIVRASVFVPLVLDLDLFRGARVMFSVAPALSAFHIAPLYSVDHLPFPPEERALYLNPQHSFAVGMMGTELTLRGVVGERFDFAVRPTLGNEAFLAAAEIRYRF